jgi:hypothetical protein
MLTLYHGSNRVFDRPRLDASRDRRDFGRGFYTTTLRSQAQEWAVSTAERYGGHPSLYVFEFDPGAGLMVKEFAEITVEWLELVKANRSLGGIQHGFDVVIGPVADDNTLRTVSLYVARVYDADEAMRRLRYFKANDQVSLHTAEAMARLEPRGREDV